MSPDLWVMGSLRARASILDLPRPRIYGMKVSSCTTRAVVLQALYHLLRADFVLDSNADPEEARPGDPLCHRPGDGIGADLTHPHRDRFQIEFNFRDAK